MRERGRTRRRGGGFSMIEVVIVLVIIGAVSAIAVPRFAGAAERAKQATLRDGLATFQRVLERYAIEHSGLTPNHADAATLSGDETAFVARLTGRSREDNRVDAAGALGPYLEAVPRNPWNGLRTVRLDGAAAGAGTHGWRFDSARNAIEADHVVGAAVATAGPATTTTTPAATVPAVVPTGAGADGSVSVSNEGVPLD